MDPIVKLEVVLNALNTAVAYAVYFRSPQLKILQDLQYAIYHSDLPSNEEMENLITKISAIKSDIISKSYEL